MIDKVASGDPSRVGVLPEGFDELANPWEVLVVRRGFRMEVLEDRPISRKDSSKERGGAQSLLLMENGS